MNKRIIIGLGIGLIAIVVICQLYTENNIVNNNLVLEGTIDRQLSNSNSTISLMYETGHNTGIYEESADDKWLDSNYIFNSELSGCENGGKLSWDRITNKIKLLSPISDKCYIYFDSYLSPVINSVTTSNVTYNSITLTINTTVGDSPITKYYFSNGEGYINNGTNNVFTFTGLNSSTNYNFKVYVVDELGYESEEYTLSASTTSATLADYIKSLYVSDGVNGLYYHDGLGSYTNANQEAGDNSYRYAGGTYSVADSYENTYSEVFSSSCNDDLYCTGGVIEYSYTNSVFAGTTFTYYLAYDANKSEYSNLDTILLQAYNDGYLKENVSNYVCFGTDTTPCPIENLYRIIGVFGDQAKLIKASSYGSYSWNSQADSNSWMYSTAREVLNNEFLNGFQEDWLNMIEIHTWESNQTDNSSNVKNFYIEEVSTDALSSIVNNKVGLIYVSDYGYASNPVAWMDELENDTTYRNDNWMYTGLPEWTITPYSSGTTGRHDAYMILELGNVYGWYKNVSRAYNIRPAFYLNSDVEYVSGTGTSSDPFVIN